MKMNKYLIASIMKVILGVSLMICGFTGILDSFWSGMGTALIVVGSIRLVQQIRYRTNAEYKESVDVSNNDERNKYLRMKAMSWAGYIFVLIAAFASIILKILGFDQLVHLASGSICLIMIMYWISYVILSKKY